MKLRYMDRDTTGALKGIALICMFIHHFFTFPDWYVDGIAYPELADFVSNFCEPLKICVPVFAFLTGYFYAGSRQRTYRYSLRKITDVYLSYWFVYLPMMVMAVVLGIWEFYPSGAVLEMLALNTPIMSFCWYVWFYACVMLLLPLLTRSDAHTPAEDVLLLLVLPVTVCIALESRMSEGYGYTLAGYIRTWFPCVASGYLFAKYELFEQFFDRIVGRFSWAPAKLVIWAGMAAAAFAGRYFCQWITVGSLDIRSGAFSLRYPTDLVYAPLFVYGAGNLLQYLRKTPVFPVLVQIGKQSLLMWFLHCIFFNGFRQLTQPILYWPKQPVLVVMWGLLLCYLAARILDLPLKRVLKLKNKYL